LLTNVTSGFPEATKAVQTRVVLERMEAALGLLGLSFNDVVRTWFFLDEILRWYDVFNRVRTQFLTERLLLSRMPASTAVGPSLEGNSALLAGLLALRPESKSASVFPVPSPAQGSAFDYGSSFSRAMEVNWSGGKRLYVSGTASIDAVGRTLHPGDLPAQVDETLRIVGDLLDSRGFSFGEVTKGICYLAQDDDGSVARVAEYFPLELSTLQASICREDLKFEIELVAERKHVG
jgi:enamine deaminase RidA (YjgF/YER057c/UK114 family)